ALIDRSGDPGYSRLTIRRRSGGSGMKCPRCQCETPPAMKFCGECGAPLKGIHPSGPPPSSYAEVTSALSEALERHTATSEILRAIASSPGQLQAVLDAVAENAARLCHAVDALIHRVDGDVLRIIAHHGPIPIIGPVGEATIPLVRGIAPGRAVLERQTIHVVDIEREAEEFPDGAAVARQVGVRAALTVPLLREQVAIGAIVIRRLEAAPFTEQEIALLETFADQAVIAIENVRLFNETKEALEQQTATSEILSIIASSPTDA